MFRETEKHKFVKERLSKFREQGYLLICDKKAENAREIMGQIIISQKNTQENNESPRPIKQVGIKLNGSGQ